MELAEYLFVQRKTRTQKEMAEKIGICTATLAAVCARKQTPNLKNALLIYLESGKHVDLVDMLTEEDFDHLQKMYGISKGKSILNLDIPKED